MIEHKFSEEDLKRCVKHEVRLEVSSKGMEPIKFESLDDTTTFIGVSKHTLTYASKHKRLINPKSTGLFPPGAALGGIFYPPM